MYNIFKRIPQLYLIPVCRICSAEQLPSGNMLNFGFIINMHDISCMYKISSMLPSCLTGGIYEYGILPDTIQRLRSGKTITTKTLNTLCSVIGCQVSDILEFVPDDTSDNP